MVFLKQEILIQILLVYRLICGFYFRISANKIVAPLFKVYCIFLASIVIAKTVWLIVNNKLDTLGTFHMCSACSLYVSHVAINLFFNGDHFIDFLEKIKNINEEDTCAPRDKILISAFILFITTLVRFYSYVQLEYDFFKRFFGSLDSVFTFSLLVDVFQYSSTITRTMMFELLWRRMGNLRKRLEQDLSIARRFDEGDEVMKEKLRLSLHAYKNLMKITFETCTPMKLEVIYMRFVIKNLKLSFILKRLYRRF
ncbi:hypothetical protein B5X24_HaOG200902 [Helicoverpa armigera]|nr:hypothetical protein B5X24_HaOG200902 [Helicoverpa armigera]